MSRLERDAASIEVVARGEDSNSQRGRVARSGWCRHIRPEQMAKNHLPGNADLASFGMPIFADEPPEAGQGYGLGVGVTIDPVAYRLLDSAGSYGWAGAANTYSRVDPAEELTKMFLTQLMPFGVHPIERRLSQLVHQAIVD